MSSRPLCLVSAGHPGRAREINHSNRNNAAGSKSNRNGNSNRKQQLRTNWNARASKAPFPSAGKAANLLGDEPVIKGKGKNMNHLLNFQSYESASPSTTGGARKAGRTRHITPRMPKGKEEFVQSVAQFVVEQGSELELEPFQVDPDLPVPWKFIEAIRIFGQEETECPICLHPPIAAKVGRCGHAHCASCVLKLLSICDYPECPVCQCALTGSDLRSVICGVERRPKSNSSITFVKMRRDKNRIVPTPQSATSQHWLNRYERVVPVSRAALVENILDREEAELCCQLADCEPSEVPFIEQAKELLQTRLANFKPTATATTTTAPVATVTASVTAEMALIENPNLTNGEPVVEAPPSGSGVEEEQSSKLEDCYYFYQSVDCGNVFLSSLNAKCLISEFGSLKDAPPTVHATMLEIDDYTMDPDVRRRFRYLGHLSLGEAFSLAYVDHEGLGLSAETFEKHKVLIQQRKKRLRKKDHEENKASKLVEEYYDRELYGKYRPADISLSSQEMFPDFGNFSLDSASSPEPQSAPISIPSPSNNSGVSSSWKSGSSWGALSADSSQWPVASPHSSSQSFWGEMKKTSKPQETLKTLSEHDVIDDESERRAPDFGSGFAADFASALAEATSPAAKNNAPSADKDESSRKPKKAQKKKKGRIIFST